MAKNIYTKVLQDTQTKARLGYIDLPHGRVETPAFMPVGTNGTVKGIYHFATPKMYFIVPDNNWHLIR